MIFHTKEDLFNGIKNGSASLDDLQEFLRNYRNNIMSRPDINSELINQVIYGFIDDKKLVDGMPLSKINDYLIDIDHPLLDHTDFYQNLDKIEENARDVCQSALNEFYSAMDLNEPFDGCRVSSGTFTAHVYTEDNQLILELIFTPNMTSTSIELNTIKDAEN